jgi:sugar-specific transcriptional regulator TrmB
MVMLTDTTAIRNYFAKLGFETEVADIYLALHAHGPQNISELSRNSGVERTRIYRLIDTLMDSGLVEVESHFKRGVIKAAPITNLNLLIGRKEQELKSLQDELGLIEQVLARNSLSNPAARIQFYRGPEGIRQMQLNLLHSKSAIIQSIMHRPIHDVTGGAFYKSWTEKWDQEGRERRILHNKHFIKLNDQWNAKNQDIEPNNYETRTISPASPVKFDTDIYDDIVAYYNWHEGEVFGFEVYNKDIADFQRVSFDMLWAQAKKAL